MNSRVLVKLLAAVLVVSNSAVLNGMKRQTSRVDLLQSQDQRLVIKVDWCVDKACYHSQILPEVQTINEQQCTHFGLNKKDSWGFAKVDAFCRVSSEDKKKETNSKINLVEEPHQYLIDKKIQEIPELQKQLGLKTQCKFLWNTIAKKKDLVSQAAMAYGIDEKVLEKIALDSLHPQFIPAEWLVDKKVGDKILVSAPEFDLEVTIAQISKDEDIRHLLRVLSWKNYTTKKAPVIKLLVICGLLGILWKYLKQ